MVHIPAWLLVLVIVGAMAGGWFLTWDCMRGQIQIAEMRGAMKAEEHQSPEEQEAENPELILIRAEIRALREQLSRPPAPWHRLMWVPSLHRGHVELPVKHYRLKKWLHARTHGVPGNGHAVRQRRSALLLLVTGLARVAIWTTLIILVALGLGHVADFTWAADLSRTVWFVALLSLYANWATDLGSTIAAYAALVASDVHSQVTVTSEALAEDIADLDSDIHRLSEMLPGAEAAALAASITSRLGGKPGAKPGGT